MKIVKVVCGIIWNDGKIFIARRKPEKSMGGYWEFPGGKIEEAEDPEAALKRELREELGMEIQIKNYFGTNIHHYDTFSIELIAYECEYISATYELADHDDWNFVFSTDFSKYKIAPADLFITNKLKQRIG